MFMRLWKRIKSIFVSDLRVQVEHEVRLNRKQRRLKAALMRKHALRRKHGKRSDRQ